MPEKSLPHTGQTTSERRAGLRTESFIKLKLLAQHVYKKENGAPLLTYDESAHKNREETKVLLFNYEVAHGLTTPDGTENIPYEPQVLMDITTMPNPPIFTGSPSEQPQPTGKPGRPRKTQPEPTVMSPQAPPAVPQQSFVMPPQVPGLGAVPKSKVVEMEPSQHRGTVVAGDDVISRLDQIGEILNSNTKQAGRIEDDLRLLAQNLSSEVAHLKYVNHVLLASMHHLYVTVMGPSTDGKASTMPDFLEYMKKFVSAIPSPK